MEAKKGWNVETLKEYVFNKIADAEKYNASRFAGYDEAVSKNDKARELLDAKSNEFRAALSDSAKIKIDRTEVQAMVKGFDDKILSSFNNYEKQLDEMKKELGNLRETRSMNAGKELSSFRSTDQKNWTIGIAIAVTLGLVSSVIALISLFK